MKRLKLIAPVTCNDCDGITEHNVEFIKVLKKTSEVIYKKKCVLCEEKELVITDVNSWLDLITAAADYENELYVKQLKLENRKLREKGGQSVSDSL